MRHWFVALALVAGSLSARADALEVYNVNSTTMDDIHLFFNGIPDDLSQDETGLPFGRVPGSPPPYEYASSGWSVDGIGGADNSIGIKGLKLVKADKVSGSAKLTDWCWSKGGSCNMPDGKTPWLKPTVKVDGKDRYLEDLGKLNFVLIAAIPEPSSWLLLVSGFGLVGGALRRRERRSMAIV